MFGEGGDIQILGEEADAEEVEKRVHARLK